MWMAIVSIIGMLATLACVVVCIDTHRILRKVKKLQERNGSDS